VPIERTTRILPRLTLNGEFDPCDRLPGQTMPVQLGQTVRPPLVLSGGGTKLISMVEMKGLGDAIEHRQRVALVIRGV